MTATEACTINPVAASIPINGRVHTAIQRWCNGKDSCRYVIRVSRPNHWVIEDLDAYNSLGNPCVRLIKRPKSEWTTEDIYSFVEHLNSR